MKEALYKRSQSALSTNVGDDWVALNVEQGKCYGMEMVTAVIWELLAEPISIRDICNQLVRHYDVEWELCKIDVEALIKQFQDAGLVVATPSRSVSKLESVREI